MKKAKKLIIIILVIVFVIAFIKPVFLRLALNIPATVVPVDDIKCGQSMLFLVASHGIPDEITYYDINGRIGLIYESEDIFGCNTYCEYEFYSDMLCAVYYKTEDENYDKEQFFADTKTVFANAGSGDVETELDVSDEKCYRADIDYPGGATGQYVSINAYDDCGIVTVDWLF